jgi:Tol biopolymer transport system component
MKLYTIESGHFRINYTPGLAPYAKEIGQILEELYSTYRNTYNLTLPSKTEVLVTNDKYNGSWALAILNMIHISLWDFDYYMRGTNDNLRDAVAHEYAHIVSISSSFKLPSWMPYIQGGFFSHPNSMVEWGDDENRKQAGLRVEAFHIFPSEVLPPWCYEGIAQFESSRNHGDRWDSHRDMIMRTLTLSDNLLSFDRMNVFSGREDDWEKTYNHGLSIMRFINSTYGYDFVVSMLREASMMPRVNFDRAVKASLGVSGRSLYADWVTSLKKHYTSQVKSIGTQVYGRKISKDGFANYWPRFSPDDKRIFFLSNGKLDFGIFYRTLYSYDFCDTVKEDDRIKPFLQQINNFYDIHEASGNIIFTSQKSRKSSLAPNRGGDRTEDIFIEKLPLPDKKKKPFAKKTERQITIKASVAHAAFSPQGDMIAGIKETNGKYSLCLVDTAGKTLRTIYPAPGDKSDFLNRIYSLDWSADGKRIAVSYVDSANRDIGFFDTSSANFYDVCITPADERDPRFSPDGKTLYFSSDRTGIFNIYRFTLSTGKLEQVTNVSGGAFAPDISHDGKKLVYANYDANGYGIYLLDSITSVWDTTLDTSAVVCLRVPAKRREITTAFSGEKPYLRFPTQFLLVPTLYSEQILTIDTNSFYGLSHFKAGAVLNLNDPFEWAGLGTNIGAFFVTEPGSLHRFIDFDTYLVNREVTFDAGLFAGTHLLPVNVDFLYAVRGIAGEDVFLHDIYGDPALELMKYNLNPRYFEMSVSHDFSRMLGLNWLVSYNNYRVFVNIDNDYYDYSPAKGFRTGLTATVQTRPVDIKYNISPKGLTGKLKYEYLNQSLQNDERSFIWDGTKIIENYDQYRYNQISAALRFAASTPWHKKHDIYTELDLTALKLTNSCKKEILEKYSTHDVWYDDLPSFFKPDAWVPGYAWYYRDTTEVLGKLGDSSTILTVPQDTMLVSGNGVLKLGLSYRLPLYSGLTMNHKIGFIYFDKLIAAINCGGGVGYNNLNDFPDKLGETFRDIASGFEGFSFKRTGILEDMLLYAGLELRLEAISFSTMPLAVKARWDWGFDRPAPYGGHKFLLSIGFSFDDWDMILEPDGIRNFR